MESYELRRGWYRNLTLRVSSNGTVRVSAPWFVPRSAVDAFVEGRRAWIDERRAASSGAAEAPDRVWVWGHEYRVRIESPGKLPRVIPNTAERELVLRVPASWSKEQHRKSLERWEASQVEEALKTLVPRWTARTGLSVERWSVKRLRSRWGSCRPDRRSLVFNARLGAFPPHCLEHVVVHELAHLVIPHHGKAFHALVEEWLPGAPEVRKLLKKGPGSGGSAGSSVFLDSPAKPGAQTEL